MNNKASKILSIALIALFSSCGSSKNSTVQAPAVTPVLHLSLIDNPGSLIVGECMGPFSLELNDTTGRLVPASSAFSVTFDPGVSNLKVFADSACASPLNVIPVASGSSLTSIYLQDETVEDLTVTLTSPKGSLNILASVVLDLVAQIQITGPTSGFLGNCIGPYLVRTVDRVGNLIASTQIVPSVSVNAGTETLATIFSDANCSVPISTFDTSSTGDVGIYIQVLGNSGLSVHLGVITPLIYGSQFSESELVNFISF